MIKFINIKYKEILHLRSAIETENIFILYN